MAAFTTYDGTNTLACLKELIRGVRERARAARVTLPVTYPTFATPQLVLIQGAYSSVGGSCFPQKKPVWLQLQEDIETLATSFVRTSTLPSFPGTTLPEMFTWATLKTDSGLTDGWRRVPTWENYPEMPPTTYEHGRFAHGDYIGAAWLIPDLQAALACLTVTKHTGDLSGAGEGRHGYGSDNTRATAEDECKTDFDEDPWDTVEYGEASASITGAAPPYYVQANFAAGKMALSFYGGWAPLVSGTATPYAKYVKRYASNYWQPDGKTEGQYYAFDTVAVAADATDIELDPMSTYAGYPYDDSGANAQAPNYSIGSKLDNSGFWLIEWDFSNA